MKDVLGVTGSDSVTHLREHGSDQAQPGTRQKLGRVEIGEQARSGGSTGDRAGGSGAEFIVVTGLFQKIEQIFTGNKL